MLSPNQLIMILENENQTHTVFSEILINKNMNIEQIKADAQEAVSNWNGEDTKGEEKASIGQDILDAIDNLEELVAEFRGELTA